MDSFACMLLAMVGYANINMNLATQHSRGEGNFKW